MHQKEVFLPLTKKKEIELVYKKGQKLYSDHLMVRYLEFPHNPSLKVLVALPREMKKAVQRNRLKRVFKAALFEGLKPWGKPKKEIICAIHVRISFLKLSFTERVKEIQKLLKPFYH